MNGIDKLLLRSYGIFDGASGCAADNVVSGDFARLGVNLNTMASVSDRESTLLDPVPGYGERAGAAFREVVRMPTIGTNPPG